MVSGEAGRRWSDRRILSGLARLVGSRADLARRIRLAITMLLVAAAATLTALAPVVFKWIVVDAFDSGISPAVAVPVALIGAYVGVQWLGRLAGELRWMVYGRLEQRVAIARAVLKQPRIFVFDEATSALDSATERLIQRNLETLLRGTTTMIVAHCLSTIVHADEIAVLDEGRIVERGRHHALLSQDAVDAAMWRRQQEHGHEPVAG